jgi:hypothetical protein
MTDMTTTTTGLNPKLAEVVEKIKNLQRLTVSTGFKTNRSQGEVLARLTPDELSLVSAALQHQ